MAKNLPDLRLSKIGGQSFYLPVSWTNPQGGCRRRGGDRGCVQLNFQEDRQNGTDGTGRTGHH